MNYRQKKTWNSQIMVVVDNHQNKKTSNENPLTENWIHQQNKRFQNDKFVKKKQQNVPICGTFFSPKQYQNSKTKNGFTTKTKTSELE
jgi:hypothetical protein